MSKACTASRISGNCGIRSAGASRAVRLVVGIEIGAEGFFRFVEHHRKMRRLVFRLHVAQQLPQHVAEAEHGIDLQAVRFAAERRQRVIGAENVARAVDQEDVVALLQAAGGNGCGVLRRSGLGVAGLAGGFFCGFRCWHGRECGPSGAQWQRGAVDIGHSFCCCLMLAHPQVRVCYEPPPRWTSSGQSTFV